MNENLDINQALYDYYLPYAKHTIQERAIVDLRDGLKPSQRVGLWAMYEAGLLKGNRMKSVGVGGLIVKYHPHSDASIYETMVRLAQSDTLLVPLIDSKGNMGQHTSRDLSASAPRYTEMRLANICEDFFKGINKDAVDFKDNFDNTRVQPVVLPVAFPNVLTVGSSGVAVGFASNIPSFNLKEVCQATIEYIKNKKISNYLVPDFATKGQLIYNEDEIKKINLEGNGRVKLRAKWYYDDDDNMIVINEIPFTTTREVIIEKIIDLVKDGKLKEIIDVRDGTDISGMKIEIDLKRSAEPNSVMNRLYANTTLQDYFSANMNVVCNDKPEVMGVHAIIKNWIAFRQECIVRQAKFDIKEKTRQLHLTEGLKKVLLDIDKAIDIIKKSENDDEAINNLMKYFEVDKEQAETIADIKLRNFNKTFILNKIKDVDKLTKELSALNMVVSDISKVNGIIVQQLEYIIKTHGVERKTEVIQEDKNDESVVTAEDIPNYNVMFYITKEGYLKKIPLTSLRSAGEHKLKDGDNIIQEASGTNLSELLIFTNKAVCYKLRAYDLADSKTSVIGDYLPTVLQLDKDETILKVIVTSDYSGDVLFAFENGKIARIELKAYETKTKRSKLINAFSTDSKIINIFYLLEDIDLLCVSSIDKVLICNTNEINSKSTKNSMGVNVLKSKNESTMVLCVPLSSVEGISDISYYRGATGAIGCYKKKNDKIILK